jgi:pilus assembly protein Flp/PilA
MRHLFREKGQGLVEYALILVLVAVLVIAILMVLGPEISNLFSRVTTALMGGGGVITNVTSPKTTAAGPGKYTLSVTVHVASDTNVTLTAGGQSSGAQSCSGSCTVSVTGVPASGTYTVTASDGGSFTGTY